MTTPSVIWLYGVFAGWAILSSSAAELTPVETVQSYFEALSKTNRVKANDLTAKFPKFGEVQVAGVTEKFIEIHRRPGFAPRIATSKMIEDCAVVILYEKPTDPDPAYLIKQRGAWRVLPELTEYKEPEFELSEAVVGRFQTLERWYREQVGKK